MKNVLGQIFASLSDEPPCLVPDIGGMTSARIRMLLNRLVAAMPPEEMYFEIGTLNGSTLVSALLDHKLVTAEACDNFSQFKDWNSRKNLADNLRRYRDRLPPVLFHDTDCWGLAKRTFPKPIGVYFYDGRHEEEDQERALTEFYPHLARTSIMVVDDWNGPQVRAGMLRALEKTAPARSVIHAIRCGKEDMHSWWNGLAAFYIEKKIPS